jgi:hypothetical protein
MQAMNMTFWRERAETALAKLDGATRTIPGG